MCKQMELTRFRCQLITNDLSQAKALLAWSRLLPGVMSSLSWEVFKPCDSMAGQEGRSGA